MQHFKLKNRKLSKVGSGLGMHFARHILFMLGWNQQTKLSVETNDNQIIITGPKSKLAREAIFIDLFDWPEQRAEAEAAFEAERG